MESFWDFSVRTYRTDGVPDACLALQNEHGVDVNLLLYCCWVGATVGEFSDRLFTQATAWSADWASHVVIPLREARTWMKHTGCVDDAVPTDACMRLRENVKSVEFGAEKLQQDVLESFASVSPQAASDVQANVAANLGRYLAHINVEESADVKEKLQVIVAAAFSGSDPARFD